MNKLLTEEMIEKAWQAFHPQESMRAALLAVLPGIEKAVREACVACAHEYYRRATDAQAHEAATAAAHIAVAICALSLPTE
jgi:hypothetical protein